MGIIDKGDAFELQLPTQVQIQVSGSFKSASNAYVETELNWLSGTPRSLIVSRTELASSVPSRFANGAALRLPPGKYSFAARVRKQPGGTIAAPNIETAAATLYDDLHHSGVLGSASVYGSAGGFVTVSHKDERYVHGRMSVYVKAAEKERVYATMLVRDVASGETIATPRVIQIGTNAYPLEAGVTPIYIKPERLYRFEYTTIYAGAAEMAVSVSVSG